MNRRSIGVRLLALASLVLLIWAPWYDPAPPLAIDGSSFWVGPPAPRSYSAPFLLSFRWAHVREEGLVIPGRVLDPTGDRHHAFVLLANEWVALLFALAFASATASTTVPARWPRARRACTVTSVGAIASLVAIEALAPGTVTAWSSLYGRAAEFLPKIALGSAPAALALATLVARKLAGATWSHRAAIALAIVGGVLAVAPAPFTGVGARLACAAMAGALALAIEASVPASAAADERT